MSAICVIMCYDYKTGRISKTNTEIGQNISFAQMCVCVSE